MLGLALLGGAAPPPPSMLVLVTVVVVVDVGPVGVDAHDFGSTSMSSRSPPTSTNPNHSQPPPSNTSLGSPETSRCGEDGQLHKDMDIRISLVVYNSCLHWRRSSLGIEALVNKSWGSSTLISRQYPERLRSKREHVAAKSGRMQVGAKKMQRV
ncbi:hypothetical protein C8R43DRAFT_986845 [Mycena crocata]|nr:hypothetical protein C8R43DRAFT_986789 [Mycena crocata]KAJ7165563.1 hypothetical protein C8R43DRAFT_986819 [Mycena crocata]KAJ7165567.1 hypothetical protein C8R43DRAFT_986845 [Mycena crocata]